MKQLLTLPLFAVLAMLGGACISPGPEQDTESSATEEVSEAQNSLVSGEMYLTRDDTACRRHDDPSGVRYYHCLDAYHYGDKPNLWQFRVCKTEVGQEGEVVSSNFHNSPITWRLVSPTKDLTSDLTFSSVNGGSSCTESVEVDMKQLPCNKDSMIEAEIVSPASCTDPNCIYPTGGLRAFRFCPAQAGL